MQRNHRLLTARLTAGLLAIVAALLAPRSTIAHPDRVEDRLLLHLAAGSHPPDRQLWSDMAHKTNARLQGAPVYTNLGPVFALALDGFKDWVEISPTIEAARPFLPARDLTATAWVKLDETAAHGGIVGLIQDNGDFEKGWLLGYNRRSFTFHLASRGADDGNGSLTVVRAQSAIEPERWYHVAGTYDGTTLRIYVNGALEGESTAQSGDILYPERGRYAAGAWVDDDEFTGLQGALAEIKVYARALPAAELGEIATRNRAWIDHRSPVNTALKFVVQPYLQFATADSIAILAETSQPARMTVLYGERQPLQAQAVGAQAALIQEVRLTGLKPFQKYFYRVLCTDAAGNLARSEVLSFQTVPGPKEAWAFGIIGDTQRNPEITRRCADALFAHRPNLVLHCGDVVDDGFAKNQWVFDLFEPSSRLFSQVPVFPVIGNHEKNAHWYYDYFSLPAPEYYYTFTAGNAQFFMIDSNKDCGPDSEQYRWLEKELRRSKATWKFTCHHHPCFSSDEDDYGDHLKGRPGAAYTWGDSNVRRLVPLYERYGVDIAFAGHIHSYERTWPILQMTINQRSGVRYIVSGGGGGGLEQAAPQRSWFSIHVQRGHHYCVASVQDRTIQFKAYDVEGRLFDTFELTKPRGR